MESFFPCNFLLSGGTPLVILQQDDLIMLPAFSNYGGVPSHHPRLLEDLITQAFYPLLVLYAIEGNRGTGATGARGHFCTLNGSCNIPRVLKNGGLVHLPT